ncbi:MAG: tRNA (N(6)-L-threonylcarbamoyladenosine(37)-C(2))-methylthiotransferase MtaB [Alphaproteobacteria bacterium]|nr:tRNA (N(6)-L-threonylcarbamoyladenosine(37)-C(2))-methylthiotransferase MtaB [Alphaproteobacteria bacterium]
MSEPRVITFGCRLNAFESQVIRRHAKAAGLADAVIVNTCAVTAEATRQARQTIRRARRENPGARIIVTGCAAQVEAARFGAMPEVDLVLGNAEKMKAESYAALAPERIVVDDIMAVRETAAHLVEGFDGRARAFVQVQQGCDHRCTFCIIPYGRGPSRSVPIADVVAQVRNLVARGWREIVLTGVDITGYGRDLADVPTLGRLVDAILDGVPELARLRLSSLDPVEIDAALFRAIAEEPRVMPHVHLSLQAGDDLVLKRMRRRHARADAIALCRGLRAARPEIVFGADFIAGFPTETEAMFARTLDLVAECDLALLHVFPYSEREGTPAARMPAMPMDIRRERARRLRAAGEARLRDHLDRRIGTTAAVLIEGAGAGRSEDYLAVATEGEALAPGTIVAMTIRARRDLGLLGAVRP